jgi:hypothetical protein
MREVVFCISCSAENLSAQSDQPQLSIRSTNLEELHYAARDALMDHFGPSHRAYRVRFTR